MLDIKWIRDNQDAFIKGLTNRFDGPEATLNRILNLDEQRRGSIQQLEEAQASANTASRAIGQARAAKNEVVAEALKRDVAGLKAVIQEREAKKREADTALRDLLAAIPNIPAADVPRGRDASFNEVKSEVGEPRDFKAEGFQPKQHFDIGEALGLMDFETAAKISGARFAVLKGALARLERALAQFMLDLHTTQYKGDDGRELGGYTEVAPPLLVRDDTMFGTAQLPKFADDQFKAIAKVPIEPDEFQVIVGTDPGTVSVKFIGDRQRDLQRGFAGQFELQHPTFAEGVVTGITPIVYDSYWLIPTAEVPLTNLVREEIVDEAKLPDASNRRDAVLSCGGRSGGKRHARHDPPAPIHQGRARLHHHA